MILLGIILLILGYFLPTMYILTVLGVILLVTGAALWVAGYGGHPVGGRRHWF